MRSDFDWFGCFFSSFSSVFRDLLFIVNQFRSIYFEYLVVDWIFLVHVSYKLAQWKWDSTSFMLHNSFATQWHETTPRSNGNDDTENQTKPGALPFPFSNKSVSSVFHFITYLRWLALENLFHLIVIAWVEPVHFVLFFRCDMAFSWFSFALATTQND